MDGSTPNAAARPREALHAALAAISGRADLHPDVSAALGFYESARRQFDRAGEHVLALAACHPPRSDAAERKS